MEQVTQSHPHHTPQDARAVAPDPQKNSNYVKNLCALWETDPRLAMAIDSVHPDDIPPLEPTKDNVWTVKVGSVYLHSKYRPLQEAATWVAAQPLDNRYAVVLSGFGLGYHVKAILEKLPEEAFLVVAEPNILLLRAALQAVDLASILGSKPPASKRPHLSTTLSKNKSPNSSPSPAPASSR
jgi:hypothetical protein